MTEQCAIVDLDGTVYRGGSLLAGARDGIEALRAAGYTIRFVSNSPTNSPADYAAKLRTMGIEADADQVVSAGSATVAALRDSHADDRVFLVGSTGLREQLRDGDLTLADDPAGADVLLASWTPEFDYGDMSDALRLGEGVPFYGTDPDRTYPIEDGLEPGSGAIIGAIESVIERSPDAIFGKPSTAMFETAVAGLDVDPADCLVVGDKRATDIALGTRVGARTVLVRTGVDSDARPLDSGPASEPDSRSAHAPDSGPTHAPDPDHAVDGLGDVESVL